MTSPAVGFVFKTMADPFAGRVTYFKVYSGVVKNDDHLLNMRTAPTSAWRISACRWAKQIDPVPELHAGDIGAVAKLKDTLTGDTLAPKAFAHRLTTRQVARSRRSPTRSRPSRATTKTAWATRSTRSSKKIRSLRFYRDPQTNEFLLAGSGQQHVEVIVSRLKKRYNVDVALNAPKIPYRETIRGRADVQGRHKKQTGGHGQFGDCWVRVEPLERGAGFEFANEIFGGSIPRNFIPAIEKGMSRPPRTAIWPAIRWWTSR